MEISEKNRIEKIKTLQLKQVFQKGIYVDIYINNYWCEGIIKDINENDKYDIIYIFIDNQMERKSNIPLSSLSIIGMNSYSQDIINRTRCLNNEIYLSQNIELINLLKKQLQEFNINANSNDFLDNKNNEIKEDKVNINIYYKSFLFHQFLCGTLIDIFVYIQNEIESGKKNESLIELIFLCFDIIIFILEQIKLNKLKMKFFINNIKSIIFDNNLFAIFSSLRIILSNIEFMFKEDFISTELISNKKSKIFNECFNIILNDSEMNEIPLQILIKLINFITLNKKSNNKNIKISKIYEIFLHTMENLYESENLNNNENKIDYYTHLKSLDLLLNYIINYIEINAILDDKNINKAINIFNKDKYLRIEDIFKYLEKLFYNIKFDNGHKSIIQSIILIRKLLIKINNCDEIYEQNIFEKLDNKYHIFNLIIDDLKRYISFIKEKNIIPEPDSIYEGIFTHKMNIIQRLGIIFFFTKGIGKYEGLKLDSKEHLEKIYSILNINNCYDESINFFNIFSKHVDYIYSATLEEFLNNIIQNGKKFDLSSFSNNNIFLFIEKVFVILNKREDIIIDEYDMMKVKKDNLIKLDLLFDILIKNKNKNIQNKCLKLLVKLCLNLYDYKTSFCQKYWKNFINTIRDLLEKEQKNNNIIALNGLIKLIDMIYSSCINNGGIIPQKQDYDIIEDPSYLYFFELYSYNRKEKKYRLKVGKKGKLLPTRYKLGYYYDIPVNNVVFEDKNGKKFSFIDDNLIFEEIFPPEIPNPQSPIPILKLR